MMRRAGATGRRAGTVGFTLIEVLVTVSIIALLAAVLFPAVTANVGKGDQARAESVLDNLQTAVEIFQTDLRLTPGGVTDLTTDIRRDSLGTITDRAYTQSDVGRWLGPYLDRSVETRVNASSTRIGTGFGSDLCNDFFVVTAASTTADEVWTTTANGSATECTDFTNTAGSFAAAAGDSISRQNFDVIDEAVDDSDGPDAGKVRLMGANDDDLVVFLLTPILPKERQ